MLFVVVYEYVREMQPDICPLVIGLGEGCC